MEQLPSFLRNVEFDPQFRGYDYAAVDDFVRRVKAYVADLQADVERAEQRSRDLDVELGRARSAQPDLASGAPTPTAESGAVEASRLLEMAQRTADGTIASAREEADEIRSRALDDAETRAEERIAELTAKAASDAERLRDEAQSNADALLESARSDAARVEAEAAEAAADVVAAAEADAAAVTEAARSEAEQARSEAEAMRADAAAAGDDARRSAEEEAAAILDTARSEADAVTQEAEAQRSELVGDLDGQVETLEARILDSEATLVAHRQERDRLSIEAAELTAFLTAERSRLESLIHRIDDVTVESPAVVAFATEAEPPVSGASGTTGAAAPSSEGLGSSDVAEGPTASDSPSIDDLPWVEGDGERDGETAVTVPDLEPVGGTLQNDAADPGSSDDAVGTATGQLDGDPADALVAEPLGRESETDVESVENDDEASDAGGDAGSVAVEWAPAEEPDLVQAQIASPDDEGALELADDQTVAGADDDDLDGAIVVQVVSDEAPEGPAKPETGSDGEGAASNASIDSEAEIADELSAVDTSVATGASDSSEVAHDLVNTPLLADDPFLDNEQADAVDVDEQRAESPMTEPVAEAVADTGAEGAEQTVLGESEPGTGEESSPSDMPAAMFPERRRRRDPFGVDGGDDAGLDDWWGAGSHTDDSSADDGSLPSRRGGEERVGSEGAGGGSVASSSVWDVQSSVVETAEAQLDTDVAPPVPGQSFVPMPPDGASPATDPATRSALTAAVESETAVPMVPVMESDGGGLVSRSSTASEPSEPSVEPEPAVAPDDHATGPFGVSSLASNAEGESREDLPEGSPSRDLFLEELRRAVEDDAPAGGATGAALDDFFGDGPEETDKKPRRRFGRRKR